MCCGIFLIQASGSIPAFINKIPFFCSFVGLFNSLVESYIKTEKGDYDVKDCKRVLEMFKEA